MDYLNDKYNPLIHLYDYFRAIGNTEMKKEVDTLSRFIQNVQEHYYESDMVINYVAELIHKRELDVDDFMWKGEMEDTHDIINDLTELAKEDYVKRNGN